MLEKVTSITSVGKTADGGFLITKEYSDGIVEQLMVENSDDLNSIIDELTDLLKGRKCPKCGKTMSVEFIKEYTCDDCQLVCPESVLDAMERDE